MDRKNLAAAWAFIGDDDRYDESGPIQPLYNLYIGGICWYIYLGYFPKGTQLFPLIAKVPLTCYPSKVFFSFNGDDLPSV